MKKRVIEYLEAAHHRRELRIHRRWQRIRRIGRGNFILSMIAGFWSLMAGVFILEAWLFLPSFAALHRLKPEFYYELSCLVLSGSVMLFFAGRYVWRQNERKYSTDAVAAQSRQ
jgi:hypothetical protein